MVEALQRLRARWALAVGGRRQFVLLSGEPGIGKTRLASEFAAELHASGATVLYGRSDYESIIPYQPFIEGLKHPEVLSLPSELRPELSELARFVPALRAHVSPGGELSLFEVIDSTTPEQWREALTLLADGDAGQSAPLFEVAHE